jgi:hypothetical protein
MIRRLLRPALRQSIVRNIVSDKAIQFKPRVDVPRVGKEDGPTRAIYFDVGATTPVDPRVLDKMLPLYTEMYGNPHSRTHEYGWNTEAQVEVAREQGLSASRIILTYSRLFDRSQS